MASMGLNTEEEGSPMAFFRRGYKVSAALPHLCPRTSFRRLELYMVSGSKGHSRATQPSVCGGKKSYGRMKGDQSASILDFCHSMA